MIFTALWRMAMWAVAIIAGSCFLSGTAKAQAGRTPVNGANNTRVKARPQTAASNKPPADGLQSQANDLQTLVHLNLGTTTVQELAVALSTQTGHKVQVEEAIRERRLTVQMNSISAHDALDTLTECHEWRWFRDEEGIFWIARRRPALPRTMDQVPTMLQAALPPDYRRFLGVGVDVKDLPPAMFVAADGTETPHPGITPERDHRERVTARLLNLRNKRWKQLLTEFSFENSDAAFVTETKNFPVSKMTAPQQTLLNDSFILDFLLQVADDEYLRLLHFGLKPYEANVNAAMLRISQGNGFDIGSVTHDAHFTTESFFGTLIPGLKPTPPAFPAPPLPPRNIP